MLIFVGILLICLRVVVKFPQQGAIEWVRIGLMLFLEFAGFVALALLSALEISPLILLLIGAVCVVTYLGISRMLPAKRLRKEAAAT